MLEKSLNLPASEMEVIRVMWKKKACTVSEIREALNKKRKEPLAHSTVVTLVQRLEAKSYVEKTGERKGKAFVYRALLQPEFTQKYMIQNFISRYFGDDPVPVIFHLIKDNKITMDDIQEIRKMLKDYEDGMKK